MFDEAQDRWFDREDGPEFIIATVRIRRGDGWNVKPEAEATDGLRLKFRRGWTMTAEDTSIYIGEVTWEPHRKIWPDDAPSWMASGDLCDVEASDSAGWRDQ